MTDEIRLFDDVRAIKAEDWDRLAGLRNPFTRHGFFRAVEESGSACPETGWRPVHIGLIRDGNLAGLMPGYLKSHSQGEYVFDHGWAEAYARAGGRYYPKWLAAVPFTPVTGPRLFATCDADKRTLIDAARRLVVGNQLSGLHINFVPEAEIELLRDASLLIRNDQQFHWRNDGYRCFDDFLGALASRKRKAVRKERADALATGLEIQVKQGDEITEADWDAFFVFYMDTGGRKWGRPYLNREFFSLLSRYLGDAIVLMFACRDQVPIAGALNLVGEDCLYGRYWGAVEHHPFLHFELCYYQAIEYAIAHRLARVEAGAQGEHKLARGYAPVRTYSAHWLADPGFHDAVARYLEAERREVDAVIDVLGTATPFKKA